MLRLGLPEVMSIVRFADDFILVTRARTVKVLYVKIDETLQNFSEWMEGRKKYEVARIKIKGCEIIP